MDDFTTLSLRHSRERNQSNLGGRSWRKHATVLEWSCKL